MKKTIELSLFIGVFVIAILLGMPPASGGSTSPEQAAALMAMTIGGFYVDENLPEADARKMATFLQTFNPADEQATNSLRLGNLIVEMEKMPEGAIMSWICKFSILVPADHHGLLAESLMTVDEAKSFGKELESRIGATPARLHSRNMTVYCAQAQQPTPQIMCLVNISAVFGALDGGGKGGGRLKKSEAQ